MDDCLWFKWLSYDGTLGKLTHAQKHTAHTHMLLKIYGETIEPRNIGHDGLLLCLACSLSPNDS